MFDSCEWNSIKRQNSHFDIFNRIRNIQVLLEDDQSQLVC